MKDWVSINGQELELMLFTIETSIKVSKRFQFFLWAQGTLQSFVPHETLLCAHGDIGNMRFSTELFSRAVLEPDVEQRLLDPVDGVLPRMIQDWAEGGYAPCTYTGENDTAGLVQRFGFDNALCHGPREMRGAHGSFFVFLRLPEDTLARSSYLVELFLPHLHMALHRMADGEQSDERVLFAPDSILSAREVQVLQWVREGKTNQEIGQILNISPFTVKNHVQKILRKLNVSNRAQAVAKGAASGLFAVAG